MLISGKAKSTKLAKDGRELMTGMYAPDDYMGTNSMLLNESHSDTTTAMEDSIVCQIPKESLDKLMNQYPDVAKEFIKMLARDVKDKEENLLKMAYNPYEKKWLMR